MRVAGGRCRRRATLAATSPLTSPSAPATRCTAGRSCASSVPVPCDGRTSPTTPRDLRLVSYEVCPPPQLTDDARTTVVAATHDHGAISGLRGLAFVTSVWVPSEGGVCCRQSSSCRAGAR
jgi:hypothetical protein